MKIVKTKPSKGPTAMQMVQKLKCVEMKQTKSKKECITKLPKPKAKTAKEKKKEQRQGEQDEFLLFLKEDTTTTIKK